MCWTFFLVDSIVRFYGGNGFLSLIEVCDFILGTAENVFGRDALPAMCHGNKWSHAENVWSFFHTYHFIRIYRDSWWEKKNMILISYWPFYKDRDSWLRYISPHRWSMHNIAIWRQWYEANQTKNHLWLNEELVERWKG